MNNITTIVSSPVQTTITTTNKYEYFGFRIKVNSITLFESVSLRVSVAYLLNGVIDSSNYLNDGTYSYMRKYITLTGNDYTNWNNDDQYIIDWVSNNFQTVLDSTLVLFDHPSRFDEI